MRPAALAAFVLLAACTPHAPLGAPPAHAGSTAPASPGVTLTHASPTAPPSLGPGQGTEGLGPGPGAAASPESAARGLPTGPWLVYYGQPEGLGDLAAVARRYKLFILQATAFTPAQLAQLKGQDNTVLAYLDVGSLDHTAAWASAAPKAAELGPYGGYPDETWMDPSNQAWQGYLLDDIARQALNGADGFMLDNLELVEHGAGAADGPCGSTCATAGLALVAGLRRRYPGKLLVQNNATSEAVRTATVGGTPYPDLIDGVLHESVFTGPKDDGSYEPRTDQEALAQLDRWHADRPGLWIGTLDFINACSNTGMAAQVATLARAHGFTPSVSDRSAGLNVVCPAP